MAVGPDDLVLQYSWREGSIPPPDHYEYTITVSARLGASASSSASRPTAVHGAATKYEPAEGTIEFLPDYPEHEPPVWRERFPVSPQQLADLFALMEKTGLFVRQWADSGEQRVGGSLEWLSVDAGGRRIAVPSTPQDADAIQPLYAFIRELAPPETWKRLSVRHEEFRLSYGRPKRQEDAK
jgi:hypothetical protein